MLRVFCINVCPEFKFNTWQILIDYIYKYNIMVYYKMFLFFKLQRMIRHTGKGYSVEKAGTVSQAIA